eukprot:164380_1
MTLHKTNQMFVISALPSSPALSPSPSSALPSVEGLASSSPLSPAFSSSSSLFAPPSSALSSALSPVSSSPASSSPLSSFSRGFLCPPQPQQPTYAYQLYTV